MGNEGTLVKSKNYINDFRGLEILRFLLSIAVIVWHYQHFFYPFVPFSKREIFLERQPFFEYLSLFYLDGLYAVHIFWFISGIIFYRIYHEKINDRRTGFWSYAINRFSRLYPLHFLMLILVLVLQQVYLKTNGTFFIYQENSIKTFFQNLLFVQSWGLNKFSYNGPTWSVSIEILVYLVFFLLAYSSFLKPMRSLTITFICFAIIQKWELIFISTDIINCFYYFFAGCLFIKIYELIKENNKAIWMSFAVLLAAYVFTLKTPGALKSIYDKMTGRLDIDILLFSILIVLLFIHIFRHRVFDRIPNRYFQFFGDMTYSTYLVHFPVQLAIYLTLKPSGYDIFFSPGFFILYMLSVMGLGRLIYRYFELPVQGILRDKFSDRKSKT